MIVIVIVIVIQGEVKSTPSLRPKIWSLTKVNVLTSCVSLYCSQILESLIAIFANKHIKQGGNHTTVDSSDLLFLKTTILLFLTKYKLKH